MSDETGKKPPTQFTVVDDLPPRGTPVESAPPKHDASQDKPPRRTRTKPQSQTSTKDGKAKTHAGYEPGYITAGLMGTYGMIGLGFAMKGDDHCATIINQYAEQMAQSWEKAAAQHPALNDMICKLLEASVAGEIIAAHMPVVMAMTQHHNKAMRASMEAAAGIPTVEQHANKRANGGKQA